MEWVETTGRTVEEAKEHALDQLGVDEVDAEFEVLEEPKLGLFGRLRTEARVRARVRPQAPPPKVERRDRRRGGNGGSRGRREGGAAEDEAATGREATPRAAAAKPSGPRRPAKQQQRDGQAGRRGPRRDEGDDVDEGVRRERVERERPELTQEQMDEQVNAVRGFLDGLLDAFGVDAEVTVQLSDDGAIEAAIDGEDVGLLLGPRGATLEAVQELARRALQQHSEDSMRLRVDVGGYRERRREALAKFAAKVAAQVVESGEPASLEPMGAADRKVVHDTVNDIDGVRTSSEGEEPRRRVVISPA
ncbi:MAG TPA: RNA-binding cell elongation regulator Jag/EloR [Acidimicrobiales bacterium]|nr:RNA-binding cell elongation regulator Jag/EloR [Acidimicrobiales bacterium]